jgi:hypothetical protein
LDTANGNFRVQCYTAKEFPGNKKFYLRLEFKYDWYIMPAALLIVCSWLILLLVFTGIGLLFQRLCNQNTRPHGSWPETFWTGLACGVFLIQIWHLGARVNWTMFLVLAFLGTAGIVWNGRKILEDLRACLRDQWLLIVILAFISLWLGNLAILPPLIYDSGLYHLNAIRWNASYPIVPGLGNLHGRLAFNCSYFLYPALLESSAWPQKSHHIANGLLLLVLYAQMIFSLFTILRRPREPRLQHIFYALLLAPVFLMTLSFKIPGIIQKMAMEFNISSPSPNFPIIILGIVLFGQLLALIENRDKDRAENNYSVIVIVLLAILGITIKLTFLVSAVLIIILALYFSFKDTGFREKSNIINLSIFITACLALGILPWLIRGIILSGYLIYPATFGAFPVKWAIPLEEVVEMKKIIYSWARMPNVPSDQVLGNWNWLGPWFAKIIKNISDVILPLLLFICGGILLVIAWLKNKVESGFRPDRWLILLPPVFSLLFWFYSAPDIRFVGASFLLLGFGAVTLCFRYISFLRSHIKKGLIIFLILFLSQNLFNPLEKNFIRVLIKEGAFRKAFSGWAVPGIGLYDTPVPELKKRTTKSGLVVYVPVTGDQCWDAPLPCTPNFKENLLLIEKDDLKSGFMIED